MIGPPTVQPPEQLTRVTAADTKGIAPSTRMFWSAEGTFPAGHSPSELIDGFIAHNEEVKRFVPAERLLVWEVTEGWEPLCEFLDVPVPDEPMPHANDRATFLDRVIGGAIATLSAWHAQQGEAA